MVFMRCSTLGPRICEVTWMGHLERGNGSCGYASSMCSIDGTRVVGWLGPVR